MPDLPRRQRGGRRGRWRPVAVSAAMLLAACGTGTTTAIPGNTAPSIASTVPVDIVSRVPSGSAPTTPRTPPTTGATTTVVIVPVTTTTTPPTSIATPSTTPTPTTAASAPAPAPTASTTPTPSPTPTIAPGTPLPLPNPAMPATSAAFDALARSNPAVSVTVRRNGAIVFASASGVTIGGEPATTDAPMVVASVSKLVVAFAIAELAQQGLVDPDAPMPWAAIGITPHGGWDDVTVRELLDHTGGMPVVRESWFSGSGDCASYLPSLVAAEPRSHRGQWTYSNGDYCALGLLVAALGGAPLDVAAQRLVFDPLGVSGAHLTTDGLLPTDVAHPNDVTRLSRLGGAGTFVVSTDDITAMLASTTAADLATLRPPAIISDQYGWGHTGTIDGAKSCAWVLEFGLTTVAATIAGSSVATGGDVCDLVVPALARDLGYGDGQRPNRTPP